MRKLTKVAGMRRVGSKRHDESPDGRECGGAMRAVETDGGSAASTPPAQAWPELSALELGMVVTGHAFARWIVRCMAATGMKDLTAIDVLVLLRVDDLGLAKKLGDICFVLNMEDSHVVSYSLKKLAGLGLVKGQKHGNEVLFSTSKPGHAACVRYAVAREKFMVSGLAGAGIEEQRSMSELARVLRSLSGRYDQAARAAASLRIWQACSDGR